MLPKHSTATRQWLLTSWSWSRHVLGQRRLLYNGRMWTNQPMYKQHHSVYLKVRRDRHCFWYVHRSPRISRRPVVCSPFALAENQGTKSRNYSRHWGKQVPYLGYSSFPWRSTRQCCSRFYMWSWCWTRRISHRLVRLHPRSLWQPLRKRHPRQFLRQPFLDLEHQQHHNQCMPQCFHATTDIPPIVCGVLIVPRILENTAFLLAYSSQAL